MNRRRLPHLLATLFAAVALPAAGGAQLTVDLAGKLEKQKGGLLCRRATHKLACSDIRLVAGKGIDLGRFEGMQVRVQGPVQVALCILVEVRAIEPFATPLQVVPAAGGSFRIGESVVFRQRAPLLSLVPLLVAGRRFFLPLGPFGHVGLGLPLVWVNTKLALFGRTSTTCPIPNEKGLIGVTIYGQGAFLALTPRGPEGRLVNVDCFEIRGSAR